jgi:CRISPR-associated protein (TIGR03984 family)
MLKNKVVDIYTYSKTEKVKESALSELFDKYEELAGDNLLLLYFADKVSFIRLSALSDTIQTDTLLEGRIFNGNAELHFWKIENNLYKYRFRCESKASKTDNVFVYDDTHGLWDFDREKNALVDRNKGIYIPFPLDTKSGSMKLTVRNYLTPDEFGRLYFYDARFVNIKNDKNEVVYE